MKLNQLIAILPLFLLGSIVSAEAQPTEIVLQSNNNYYSVETTPDGSEWNTIFYTYRAFTIDLEDWMFETAYLEVPPIPVEQWMSDDCWLFESTELPQVESWMIDDQYLKTDHPQVEAWMMNENYLSK